VLPQLERTYKWLIMLIAQGSNGYPCRRHLPFFNRKLNLGRTDSFFVAIKFRIQQKFVGKK